MKVVLIVADTFRRDHLGAYGNRWIRTPQLDRLAAESAVFEHAYIGSFPTVPNRRDTFLGHGDRGVPFNRWKGIEPDEVTLPERLAEQGIVSMMVTDTANTVTGGVNLYKGLSAWYCNRGQEGDPHWLDASVPLEFPVPPELIRYNAQWWHQVLINRAHRRVEEDWFAPGTYAAAIRWLERNYQRDRFFLYVDTFDPHEPWDPPAWYERLYDPDFRGRRFEAPTYGIIQSLGITERELHNIRARYAGEVTMVDTCVGRLLATLERLDIARDTLLIFTSDHGAYFGYPGDNGMICKMHMLGADGRFMAGGQPPLAPYQWYPHYTGVCRIPLIIRLRGERPRRIRAITQPWDLAPTILDAFGLPTPPQMWGRSLLPLVTGQTTRNRKVAVLGQVEHTQVMTPRWMYAVWRGHREPLLHDLQADPDQSRNVIADYPQVAQRLHRHVVAHFRRQGLEEQLEAYK